MIAWPSGRPAVVDRAMPSQLPELVDQLVGRARRTRPAGPGSRRSLRHAAASASNRAGSPRAEGELAELFGIGTRGCVTTVPRSTGQESATAATFGSDSIYTNVSALQHARRRDGNAVAAHSRCVESAARASRLLHPQLAFV